MPMKRLCTLLLLAGCAGPAPVPGVFEPSAQSTFVPAGAALELLWNDGEFTEGPALGPDGTICFSDIGHRIMKFDPKTRRTTVHRDPSGKSNGLKFDSKGRLVACEGAAGGTGDRAGVYVFGPAGETLAFIKMPGDPTNCSFGGPSEPTTLYITGQGPEEAGKPRRYGLFRIKPAMKGRSG
jgi:sugar lactone lactonase YvrE